MQKRTLSTANASDVAADRPAEGDSAAATGPIASTTNPAATPTSVTPGTEVNQIVLHYLQSKGYARTASSLQSEAHVQSLADLAQTFHPTSDVSLPNYVLFYNEAEQGNPDAYRSSYSTLRYWIDRSLELYQPELRTVAYPVFVHAYLELVNKELGDTACAFWDAFHGDFDWRHPEDLRRLAQVTEPAHVRDNPLAQTLLTTKYNVIMSKVAFELLMSFLQENQFMLLLRIINQHVNIKLSETPTADSGDVGVVGASHTQLEQFAQERLTLGQLPPSADLRHEVEQTLKEATLHSSAHGGDPGMGATAAAVIDGVPAETLLQDYQRLKKEASGPDAVNPTDIPYPPFKAFDVKDQLHRLADARKRVAQSREALPSVCAFTLHNTHDTLNCTAVTEDLSLLAGGFSESYIKLWSLTGEPLRGLRSNFNPALVNDMDDLNRFRERAPTHEPTDASSSPVPLARPYKKLVGHSGPVFGMDVSHDGRFLLSGSEDKTVRLWSLDTFTNLVCYRGHNYPVWDVAFGPYGVYFATASHDKTARLWSCEHIAPLRIFAGHLADVDVVRFHPNSKYIVTGSTDRTCRLWDVQRGSCVRVFTPGSSGGTGGPITAMAVAPNGRTMASACEDRSITLWDLGSGKRLQHFTGHDKAVYSLAFSQESTLLMSGSADCTVRLWDVNGSAVSPAAGEVNTARPIPNGVDRHGSMPLAEDTTTTVNGGGGGVTTSGSSSTAGAAGKNGKRKAPAAAPAVVDPNLLATFATKRTPVYQVYYTKRNLGVAVGAFMPPN
ncbi:Transcription initiation factor TFIID subunit 5 [Tieghemiomyces parasiticus]|uniref:Transcription initiation factor TFIID subunit 5 n=1 Tax=Tieghemiomyces parasiticus TaxID=78921 RepID=A0A9W8A7X1_9FUNG|nr:Transcription initiation factor TFIID subunit 5 [Tieghemiomyces parasiticus]